MMPRGGLSARGSGVAVLFSAALASIAGCARPSVDVAYGSETAASASLNGFSVFESMIRARDNRVVRLRGFSPRIEQCDVIVWTPDDFLPPSAPQRALLERWLAGRRRTLIYVGRDFDAAPRYWEWCTGQEDGIDAREAWILRAAALVGHERRRALVPDAEFARWFTARRLPTVRPARQFDSRHGWLDGIDRSQLSIDVGTRLDVPSPADIALLASPATSLGPAAADLADTGPDPEQRVLPSSVEVLLSSDRGPLVSRVTDTAWGASQVIVVVNGSLLVNFALARKEHRKLADRLANLCGSGHIVGFLNSDVHDRVVADIGLAEAGDEETVIYRVWPLGIILAHGVLIGIVACLVWFPAFGRMREVDDSSTSDFSTHIQAVGKLLRRSRGEEYARQRIHEYQRFLQGEP